eukprot:jgi/Botrbrau1/17242/Bobra.0015s0004.2
MRVWIPSVNAVRVSRSSSSVCFFQTIHTKSSHGSFVSFVCHRNSTQRTAGLAGGGPSTVRVAGSKSETAMESTNPSESVVICGGGIIGCSIAYYLSLRGIGATVIERESVACAASGKAGGFLALDWNDGSPVGPLARRSFALHQHLADTFGAEAIGYRRVTTLQVAAAAKGEKRKRGGPDWLDGKVVSVRPMADESTTAQVHPGKLTRALMEAAEQKGARLLKATVTGLRLDPSGTRIEGVVVGGVDVVPARVCVLALGPWTGRAGRWLPSLPEATALKAHSIVLKPPEPCPPTCLFLSFRPTRGKQSDPEVYPRPDGTVYICGESEYVDVPEDPATITPRQDAISNLQEVGSTVSSRLEAAEVLQAQACFLPLSEDSLPLMGPVPGVEGLYLATGHSCWGILNGPATGEAMAELILDGAAKTVNISRLDPARFAKQRVGR